MRIAELSRASGVPVPTIKYYQRAGLLPPGERTAPNQADYGEQHVHRLGLIRALVEAGGLSIAAVGDLLTTIDNHGIDLDKAIGIALNATMPHGRKESANDEHGRAARAAVENLITEHHWQISPDSEKVAALTSALAQLFRLSPGDPELLTRLYVDAADRLAEAEIDWIRAIPDRETAVEAAIVGTFVGGNVFNALRVIAHESHSRQRLRGRSEADGDSGASAD